MPDLYLWHLYCVMCLKIAYAFWEEDFCVIGKIGLHFYRGFRKKVRLVKRQKIFRDKT